MFKLLLWLKSFFAKLFYKPTAPAPSESIPSPIPPENPKNPNPIAVAPIVPADEIMKSYTRRALDISQRFEGQDPWANITGNFDGAGLTCGALGWTVKWNNQQRLVKEYVNLHGTDKAKALMPACWNEYWTMCGYNESTALSIVDHWSSGSSVHQPYKDELRAFWKSDEMIAIQVKYAEIDMGKFAMAQSLKTKDHLKADEVKFSWFAYWFDHAVLSGASSKVDFSEAEACTIQDVFSWMSQTSGYCQADFNNNLKYWKMRAGLAETGKDQLFLFKLGHLRAKLCRAEFDTVYMNRRGCLSLGLGYVNEEFIDLRKALS